MADFGDYVLIEMKRYGAENEMYLHKVIGALHSSHAVRVPIDAGPNGSGHDELSFDGICEVLRVVQCGVCEDRIFKVRAADCKPAH